MRCFIAVDLPEKVKDVIVQIQNNLEKKNLFSGKLIKKENLHLTLKFLNEIDKEKAEKIKIILENVKLKKFKVKLSDFGVFSENFIKIIWVKMENCDELQKQIDKNLEHLFQKEKNFVSHITIARVKNVEDKQKLTDELKRIKMNEEFIVDKFSLKKSTLTENGPVYEDLTVFELG